MKDIGEIRLFHVGGRGGIGFGKCLFKLNPYISLTIFEADIDKSKKGWIQYKKDLKRMKKKHKITPKILPYCLFDKDEKRDFYCNQIPTSSSLFPVDNNAKKMVRWWIPEPKKDRFFRLNCKEMCKTKQIVELEVTSIDNLYKKGECDIPHFLSIDVQGAEYEVMRGSKIAFDENLLGIISEVEFSPLYKGQKLFSDQFDFLIKNEFNFIDFLHIEHWHPYFVFGKGRLMVAEALFLRDFKYFIKKYKNDNQLLIRNLLKLAAVANCFEIKSYAFEIIEYLINNFNNHLKDYIEKNKNITYLGILKKMYKEGLEYKKNYFKYPNILKKLKRDEKKS